MPKHHQYCAMTTDAPLHTVEYMWKIYFQCSPDHVKNTGTFHVHCQRREGSYLLQMAEQEMKKEPFLPPINCERRTCEQTRLETSFSSIDRMEMLLFMLRRKQAICSEKATMDLYTF